MAQTAQKTKSKTKAKTKKKTAKLPKRKKTTAKKTASKKTAKKASKTSAKKTKAKARPKAKAKTAKKVKAKTTKKATTKSVASPNTRMQAAKALTKGSALKMQTSTRKDTEALATTASATSGTTATETQTETPRLAVGDQAPDFSLPDQNGKPVRLSDYRGQNVLLFFYPKDDTPGCTKEACSFRDNLPDFTNTNAVVLGVSFDDAYSHQRFIEKYQLNFPLLSDLEKKVATAYGVYVQKNMYGNVSWGIERSTFLIDKEGTVAALWRKVQVDGHTEQVLDALRKLS